MKKIVWSNKSNGQLCITIPKDSGIKEGDVVNISKDKITRIVYSPITADLFHYGHLRMLELANEQGDLHICGVLTDEAIKSYKAEPIASLKERMAIVSALRPVDMIMVQKSKDPTDNLKQIRDNFPHTKIILVYGSDWKEIPGTDFIKNIGGEIFQPDYYDKLSTKKVLQKMLKLKK